jgi:23S rRNA (cytosine1962-C5)-methyltransferase
MNFTQPYPTLQLKSGKDRAVIFRHPWIFSGAVQVLPQAQNGDIVAVANRGGEILGYGFYSPKSQIVCRLFHFGQVTAAFDGAYWAEKVSIAAQMRRLVLPKATDTFRLLHAEGDSLPGFIADVYGQVVVIQVLTKGAERVYPLVEAAIRALGYEYIYLNIKENSGFLEQVTLSKGWVDGKAYPDTLWVQENGLRFSIDIEGGQKTGFFIDQRDNRQLVRQLSRGKTVLNAFSYTGGFSVYALAGGAASVDSVDVSKAAIAQCEQIISHNFAQASHQGVAEDCFKFLRDMPDNHYDLIILDPPAFAKNARAVPNASRGYKDLNLAGFRKIKKGGLLFTFSCSGNISRDLFRKIVFGAAADAGREVRIVYQLTQPADHPVNIYHPEGEYLKGLVLHVS